VREAVVDLLEQRPRQVSRVAGETEAGELGSVCVSDHGCIKNSWLTPRIQDVAEERWLVVGLGNPGPEYARNRHNVGFLVADELAERAGARFKRDRSRAQLATGRLAGTPVILAKPMSYMNVSGRPVAALRNLYKLPGDRIVVIHDELDIPFAEIRLKFGGGDNGHNGLRSVTSALGSRDYNRIRIGIGRPPGRMDPADFVLHDFAAAERKVLPDILNRSADAAEVLLERGLAAAQNAFH
jgi:peptidyl-tRNA hydrolase, PTH1 family